MRRKGDLSDFGVVIGVRQAGKSISESADMLGFSCTAVFSIYKREFSNKQKISSDWQCSG